MKPTAASRLRVIVNRSVVGLVAVAALVMGAAAAQAHHRPDGKPTTATSWSLVQPVVHHGDVHGGGVRAGRVVVEYVDATPQRGELHLKVVAEHGPDAACPYGYGRFRLSWEFGGDITRLANNDKIHVRLRNEPLGPNTCERAAQIAPWIAAYGSDGVPAGILDPRFFNVAGVSSYLTDGATQEVVAYPASDHAGSDVGSTEGTIVVPDNPGLLSLVHRGYFIIKIGQLGHFLYEVVYLYEADADPDGNRPPPAPTPLSPANNLSWAFPALDPSAITFQWDHDGDPDGDLVSFYLDIWQYSFASGGWVQVFKDYVQNSSELRGFQPGSFYAWRVAAVDQAKNSNPWYTWSTWSYFSTR